MQTKMITADMVRQGRRRERFTNLGAGFHLDVGNCTEVTVNASRNHLGGPAAIHWVNTYGNTYANCPGHAQGKPHYAFTPEGLEEANRILRRIEREH